MRKFADVAVSVVATFIITLFLQALVAYLAVENGSVTIGPSLTIQGQKTVPVQLTNLSDSTLNGLRFTVPATLPLTATITSAPLQIVEVSGVNVSSSEKLIEVSGFEPRTVSKLLLPIPDNFEENDVRLVNAQERDIRVSQTTDVPHPWRDVLTRAAAFALVNALLYGAMVYYLDRQGHKTRERLKETGQQVELVKESQEKIKEYYQGKLEEQLEKLDSVQLDLARILKAHRRNSLLMLARIADYRKEIDFWHDTIRKMLYQSTRDQAAAETVIESVTATLQTYKTLERADLNSEVIDLLESVLKEGEVLSSEL